jgi:hypothetical protein
VGGSATKVLGAWCFVLGVALCPFALCLFFKTPNFELGDISFQPTERFYLKWRALAGRQIQSTLKFGGKRAKSTRFTG